MGYIYKITNKINNKIYIGKTINSIQHRWNDHIDAQKNKRANYLLYKAINKYGIENFTIEQVEECDNILLNEREKYWIKIFGSYCANGHGYNMTIGGEGVMKYSDEDILKLWNQGLKSNQIAEQLGASPSTISARLKVLKPGEARKRHFKSNKKSILQYDLYGNFLKKWSSVIEAEKELNIASGSITRCCKHQMTFTKNSFWLYEDDITPITELMINYAQSTKCCAVDLIDEKGQILEQFNSAADAERIKNITRGKISEVCNHKYGRKTAGGYRWQWSYPIKRELLNI